MAALSLSAKPQPKVLERLQEAHVPQLDVAYHLLRAVQRLLVMSRDEGRKHAMIGSDQCERRGRLMARYWMLRYYEDAIDMLQTTLRPAASTWHDRRRADIIRDHPEVAKLMRSKGAELGYDVLRCNSNCKPAGRRVPS